MEEIRRNITYYIQYFMDKGNFKSVANFQQNVHVSIAHLNENK